MKYETRQRIRQIAFSLLTSTFILFANGCATRTVVIDSRADVVRLGPDVTGKVYVWRDGAWTLTGKVKLPEGWYAGPPPAER